MQDNHSNIIKFPQKGKSSNELKLMNSGRIRAKISRLKYYLIECFHSFVNNIGFPCIIGEADIYDDLTQQDIKIKPGIFFTVLTINGRDYYFRRLTGKFDGTGSSLN
jgi:hypothetical protein